MLSSLSVSCRPESRLRHWCSSIYLRIPPLHMEFHSPLLHSRKTVSDAVPRLSRGLSHQTYFSACARFTPNKSGQRLPPTYYRGCWHVVSRGFLVRYRQGMNSYSHPCSSLTTEFYDPKTFFTHAALLGQTFVHCRRFPTAASRRSLGRVSVPMWPITLSGRLCIVALVSRYLTNQLMHRGSIHQRHPKAPFKSKPCGFDYYTVLAPVSKCYPPLLGRLPTCYSPVRHSIFNRCSKLR